MSQTKSTQRPQQPPRLGLVAMYAKSIAGTGEKAAFVYRALPVVAIVVREACPCAVVLTEGGRLVAFDDPILVTAIGQHLGIARMSVPTPCELRRDEVPLKILSQYQRNAAAATHG